MTDNVIRITKETADEDAVYILGKIANADRAGKRAIQKEESAAEDRRYELSERIEAGKRLIEVRNKRSRQSSVRDERTSRTLAGTWRSWLQEHHISKSTAQDHMKLAGFDEEQHEANRAKEAERKRTERAKTKEDKERQKNREAERARQEEAEKARKEIEREREEARKEIARKDEEARKAREARDRESEREAEKARKEREKANEEARKAREAEAEKTRKERERKNEQDRKERERKNEAEAKRKAKEAEKWAKERAEVAAKDKERFDKAMAKALAELEARFEAKHVELQRTFWVEVNRIVREEMPERVKRIEEQAKETMRDTSILRRGIAAQMSMDDYRFLCRILHPDRTPSSQERSEGFVMIRKLDRYIKVAAENELNSITRR